MYPPGWAPRSTGGGRSCGRAEGGAGRGLRQAPGRRRGHHPPPPTVTCSEASLDSLPILRRNVGRCPALRGLRPGGAQARLMGGEEREQALGSRIQRWDARGRVALGSGRHSHDTGQGRKDVCVQLPGNKEGSGVGSRWGVTCAAGRGLSLGEWRSLCRHHAHQGLRGRTGQAAPSWSGPTHAHRSHGGRPAHLRSLSGGQLSHL